MSVLSASGMLQGHQVAQMSQLQMAMGVYTSELVTVELFLYYPKTSQSVYNAI